jgi:hypothetical protein
MLHIRHNHAFPQRSVNTRDLMANELLARDCFKMEGGQSKSKAESLRETAQRERDEQRDAAHDALDGASASAASKEADRPTKVAKKR